MTCAHENLHIMDYIRGWSSDEGGVTQHVNRVCDKCLQHWAGPVEAVKEYTRAEWDAYLDECVAQERAYCAAWAAGNK